MKYVAPPILVLALGCFPALAQNSDTTAPLPGSFSFTPSSVDVSSAQQAVIVSAVITDDLSGVRSGTVGFTSPSVQFFEGSFFRTAGNARAKSGFHSNADLNADGVVDVRDLMVVTKQLTAGTTCQ
jgi:hypothetical protein